MNYVFYLLWKCWSCKNKIQAKLKVKISIGKDKNKRRNRQFKQKEENPFGDDSCDNLFALGAEEQVSTLQAHISIASSNKYTTTSQDIYRI